MRVGRIQDNWVLNPTFQQLAYSDMELVVAGSQDSIMMVEGGALEVSEEDVVEALTVAQKGIRELIGCAGRAAQADGTIARRRWSGRRPRSPTALTARCKALADGKISEALNQKDKHGAHRRPSSA